MDFRPRQTSSKLLFLAILGIALFQLATHFRMPSVRSYIELAEGKVVVTAPIQLLMYAGDRFLAADIETMRVTAIGSSENRALTDYRIRAHGVVAQLNPCHEDNFYLSNAMLSWGGAVDAGNNILQRATECRYWDDIPPFFLGFNRYFFYRDIEGARQAIDTAATRSMSNRAALQQISIVMASKRLKDERMAAEYLRNQRDQTSDPNLVAMLDRRLQRLDGLIALREAQTRFEKRYGRSLTDPNELISSSTLEAFPEDPMRLGYEFVDGHFRMRAANIGGIEIRQ